MKKKCMYVLVFLLMFSSVFSIKAEAAERAVRKDNVIYYSIGTKSVQYNLKTKSKKVIHKDGTYRFLTKGKNVFCTYTAEPASQDPDSYVYRLGDNGKKKKKLAYGQLMGILGKHIYYIGFRKTIDGYVERTGIYQMNLDGSKKKRIYKSANTYSEKMSGSVITFYETNAQYETEEKKLNVKTGEIKVSAPTYTSKKNKNGKYSFKGKKVYQTKNGKKTLVTSLKQNVDEVVDLNDYVLVITTKEYTGYVYLVKNNGKKKKLLETFTLAQIW